MKKNEKKKSFDLYSKNEEISNLIKEMKSNSNIYLKLISVLQYLGHFDEEKNEVEIYDSVEIEENKKIRLWCSDLDDNIFIFYAKSNDKKDIFKIVKETNEKTIEYDLSLAKKYDITSDNIELTRTGKILSFTFGRLITDDKSFYSLFMSGDLVFQVSGDFDKELTNDIIVKLNNFLVIPTLSEFIRVFEIALSENDCSFSELNVLAFKEGIKVGNIVVGEQRKDKANLLKRIK